MTGVPGKSSYVDVLVDKIRDMLEDAEAATLGENFPALVLIGESRPSRPHRLLRVFHCTINNVSVSVGIGVGGWLHCRHGT